METIQVQRSDGVVTITLDRPEVKNAIDGTMWDELLTTFRSIYDDPDDRVVVLAGAGGEFCSGADVRTMGSSVGERSALAAMREVSDVALALHRLPQPVIAKVRGVAAGAGCNLALAADLVVASSSARFSEIFTRRGLSVDFGGTWLLPRLVGLHRAKELAFFADVLSAEEVHGMGLLNRVVADDELDGLVAEWAARLATGPTLALSMTKKMLNDSMANGMEQAVEEEARSQAVNFGTTDTAEAIQAFLERREPRFEGR
jgi:2-(1,2-epoxy-1,2-dihydrophenyl)acetyl-CoA isomerase